GGLGDRLAEQLRARGDTCTVVHAGSGRPEDLEPLIQAVAGSDRPPCRGIIPLWNLGAPAPDGLDAAALPSSPEAGRLGAVWLVQAWDRVAPDRSAPLFLVTRGAQSVGERAEPSAIAQAPAVGLGRVIAGEYPRLRCKLVDLDPAAV